MVSKKLLVLIIALVVVIGIAFGALLNEGFKVGLSSFLKGTGGAVWAYLSNGWINLATIVGASGTTFLIYTCGILLAGGILFVVLNRAKNAGKIPLIKKIPSVTPPTAAYQDQLSNPEPYTPTSNPKPEPKTEEVVAE